MPVAACIRVLSLAAAVVLASAGDFLSQHITKELIEETLVAELTSAAGNARIAAIEQELLPTFASLPKNDQDQVEASVARYVLHRYFVQKHGWYVKGLSSFTYRKALDDSSAEFVTELAPAYIQEVLRRQLEHDGMNLRDLAVFAATMGDLIRAEGLKNLYAMYDKLGVSASNTNSIHFLRALRGYLATVVIGFDDLIPAATRNDITALENHARDVYPEYDDLVMWIQDTRLDHRFLDRSRRNPFVAGDGVSFYEVDRLMQALYHQFGTLNNRECATLKEGLVADEYPNTGRVPLSKFYASTENDLKESVDYIRSMGALDEVDAENPTLVIPNYMSSPARCMPFSSYFSVCCPDACESVLRQIEATIAEPLAEPRRIADIVSGIPSETQMAPRNLSSLLLSRLEEIGKHHHGQVPLHGRLFMQWLHHAFPRECPYPHASGTVNPVSQEEWILMHEELDDVQASHAEMESHMSKELLSSVSIEGLPWTDVEELVAVLHKPKARQWRFFRQAMMVAAVLSFALPLLRASAAMLSKEQAEKSQMHFV